MEPRHLPPLDDSVAYRFYGDLAPWWPLISPPAEYADESAFVASVLRSVPIEIRDVLELGSGGGHSAWHLKQQFAMTLVDLSPQMLAMSRQLNPECAHHEGDMRMVRLERAFDAIFVHDAIDYMLSEADLRQVFETAFRHCRPSGVAVFVPDHVAETFVPTTEHGGGDADDGRAARYLSWTWDPSPDDSWVQTEYAFLLRQADGGIESVHETHRTGLFSRQRWLDLLSEAGFAAGVVTEQPSGDRPGRELLVGHRLTK